MPINLVSKKKNGADQGAHPGPAVKAYQDALAQLEPKRQELQAQLAALGRQEGEINEQIGAAMVQDKDISGLEAELNQAVADRRALQSRLTSFEKAAGGDWLDQARRAAIKEATANRPADVAAFEALEKKMEVGVEGLIQVAREMGRVAARIKAADYQAKNFKVHNAQMWDEGDRYFPHHTDLDRTRFYHAFKAGQAEAGWGRQ
ncbi:MAG: hypothetical protein KKC37_00045 [Proteobacteria bacterium]|nr:hypothetical protein [Pseudomonadota bacterium]